METVSKKIMSSVILPSSVASHTEAVDLLNLECPKKGFFKCLMKILNAFLKIPLVAVLLGLLTSCYPWFDNPLPIPTEGLKIDNRILGSWAHSENGQHFGKGDTYVHVYPQKSGWVDVFYFEVGNEGCTQFSGYTAKIGDTPVLCLWTVRVFRGSQGEIDVEKSPRCWLFPYKVTDNGMFHVWGIDQTKLERHMDDGKLKGEITRTPSKMYERKDVRIQGSSEELETFFKAVGVGNLIGQNPEMSFFRLSRPDIKPFIPPEKP